MKSVNIYYNEQQDTYLKIDKQTGTSQKSHRNGSNMIRFKVQYSGTNYLKRKEKQHNFSPKSLKAPVFHIIHKPKYTTPVTRDIYKRDTTKREREVKSVIGFTMSRGEDSRIKIPGRSSSISQPQIKPSEQLQTKMIDFCKIKQKLYQENHSPKSGYQGSIKYQKISGEYQNGLSQGINANKTVKKIVTTSNSNQGLLANLVLKNQLQKQRDIFFRYNSSLKPQNNQRQKKQLIERKTNLKILENLFISNNNKSTNAIYQ